MSSGDTAWVLASAALVMIMTPALGFFYGGLVGRKNALAVMGQSFVVLCIVSVQWVLLGYSLAFGPDAFHGLIGGLSFAGLNGVGAAPDPAYAPTIPAAAFMIFQAMFAIITPALITGALVGRMKFSAFVAFVVLWATFVYDPIAHWVWGQGGWLHSMGILDFAGGTVVHISSGVAALAAALVLGPRLGFKKVGLEPHNATYVLLGASLLWFGWFGFNAGSAVAAGALATNAFMTTNTATAAAALSWMAMTWKFSGKPSMLGAASGAVAGLVAITPASGFVDVWGALAIGVLAGVFCFFAVGWRNRTRVDDTLDAWGVHGVGGTWGALATGLFATTLANPAGANGLFYGNPGQLLIQSVGVGASWLYSFVMTIAIMKLIDMAMGLRVDEKEEEEGLDVSQHGERAYSVAEFTRTGDAPVPHRLELAIKDSDRELVAELIRQSGSLLVSPKEGRIIVREEDG
ncbi:MAG: ammonium transporter [Nitrososphaerota archaeon]|nr:ammonium transporter [Nitrososphaerota archaeon]MDG6938836.1 ammonium transporter [Nitrososphaerota archaeon]